MNKLIILTILIGILTVSCQTKQRNKNNLKLPLEWKFQTGDNPEYANPSFDDQAWKTIQSGNSWEKQGFPDYTGTAWYRIHIVIPSSFRNTEAPYQYLHLSLGKIDDCDDTFLNGKHIGRTETVSEERGYLLPYDLIQWDKENVIAVKVLDWVGDGGLINGTCSLNENKLLKEFVQISTEDKPINFTAFGEPSKTPNILNFKFRVPFEKIEGTVISKVYEWKNPKNIVFKQEDKISVGSRADSVYRINLNIKEPNWYKIEYLFTSKSFPDTLKCTYLLTYLSSTRENEQFKFPVVKQLIPDKTSQFGLENMVFEGYINDRLNANLVQRLLNIDENGILECYYNRPGKQTWAGEYTGKYLHAASRVWHSTKNVQLKTQMDRIAEILIACQNEDGYLGTYIPSNYWHDWDAWAHKYNILGLLSYYSVTGYKPALEASIKMGDLLCRTFGENPGQLRIIKNSPHVGMASTSVLEPMIILYQFTSDKKYLDFCYYILKAYEYPEGPKIVSTLNSVGKVDKTANAKAYEMMSNLTGIVKLYQLTGDEKLLTATKNAWADVAKNKLYITGTTSSKEHFLEDLVLPAENDVNMGEGCVTTTWLQFSQALYDLTGEEKYVQEIEKSVYNHLFAAENPETGCVSYYTALQGKKPYRCTINAHCCLASIPRGIAAIPELAFTRNADNGLNINLYTGGKITDKVLSKDGIEVNLECNIVSKFPEEGAVTITLNPEIKANFRLALRVPVWCRNFKATVGSKVYSGVPGQYLNIEQNWDKNTTVNVSFGLNPQVLDGGKSYPGYKALKIGAQVLAVDQSLNPEIKDLDKIFLLSTNPEPQSKTLLPKEWIGSQIYKVKANYEGKTVDLNLVPFADASQTGGDIRVWIKK